MRRDDPDAYQVGPPLDLPAPPRVVISALTGLVTEARKARIGRVVSMRTESVIPVLDGITDPHNASAVLRSADAFGVQEVHVVDGPNGFAAAHAISKGTDRWLDVVRYKGAAACARALEERGFTIVVATMDGALGPRDLDALPKVAIVFGNEHAGVSGEMRAFAKDTYAIPMRGFAESLNVSVAAAISLFAATERRAGDLSSEARERLVARFLMNTVRDAERILAEHLARHSR